MVELIAAIVVLLLSFKAIQAIKSYVKYIKLRFRLFALRDRILHLALDGIITDDHAAQIYNVLNWPLRHLLVFPVVICFRNLARAMNDLEETRKRFESMPPELQEWYAELGTVTLDIIRAYTPYERLLTKRDLGFLTLAFYNWLVVWMGIQMFMFTITGNPLAREAMSDLKVERLKAEREASIRARDYARDFRNMATAH